MGPGDLLYQTYQAQRDATAPVRALAALTRRALAQLPGALADHELVRRLSGGSELVARARLTHTRPPFGISTVRAGGETVAVNEEVVASSPFGSLLHFAKQTPAPGPRVLVVAALAGHFSTLLRPTVHTLLRDHDVYITDWHNARDISVQRGGFDLGDYVEHVVGYLRRLGPGTHLLAVCQPCPAALAATALLAEADDVAQPATLTLMAGPVDARLSPTRVNELATSTPLEWFEQNVITTVPLRYPGACRRVYPGFMQLLAFVSMNVTRHWRQHVALFDDVARGALDDADRIRDFYDEYFAVLDLPAEFYLQTVDQVFQRHLLPKGELTVGDRRVDLGAIRRTAVLTVEGERDDICGAGQTSAALDLCTGVKVRNKQHHLQPGVGHYGVFSGSRWDGQIYPVVRNFVLAHS
ncbi:MAG TPA: polyhydroxyalkanoate depolymerase [Acidimicrobiales bacterium]|jgi:polyhydroxyalkanoate depolymerase